jgi:hypothetical protein
LHESRRNSVRGPGPRIAQLLAPKGIEIFWPAGCFTFSTVAEKITRARNQRRPGTSGGGRNQEGEALNRTASVEPAPAPAGESAHGPSAKGVRPMTRLRRTPEGNATFLGCWTAGGYVRSVYAPEPPLCTCLRAWRGSVRRLPFGRSKEVLWWPWGLSRVCPEWRFPSLSPIPFKRTLPRLLACFCHQFPPECLYLRG